MFENLHSFLRFEVQTLKFKLWIKRLVAEHQETTNSFKGNTKKAIECFKVKTKEAIKSFQHISIPSDLLEMNEFTKIKFFQKNGLLDARFECKKWEFLLISGLTTWQNSKFLFTGSITKLCSSNEVGFFVYKATWSPASRPLFFWSSQRVRSLNNMTRFSCLSVIKISEWTFPKNDLRHIKRRQSKTTRGF